jgi:hypothetical protein
MVKQSLDLQLALQLCAKDMHILYSSAIHRPSLQMLPMAIFQQMLLKLWFLVPRRYSQARLAYTTIFC